MSAIANEPQRSNMRLLRNCPRHQVLEATRASSLAGARGYIPTSAHVVPGVSVHAPDVYDQHLPRFLLDTVRRSLRAGTPSVQSYARLRRWLAWGRGVRASHDSTRQTTNPI